jgi:NADH-quinone oxidoreductase subunit M
MDLPRILLLAILIVPAVAAAAVALMGRNPSAARTVSLAAVVLNLALTAALVVPAAGELAARPAEPAGLTFRPLHEVAYDVLPLTDPASTSGKTPAIQFYLGLDGLNVWLVALTSLLMVPSVLVSWTSITERVHEFYAWLLLLQTAMLGVFVAFDVVLFYVFFELTLVPMFFLIGIWGGPAKREAARKFFLFTLTGSLITLLGVFGVVLACFSHGGELTFSIPRLVEIVQTRLAIDTPAERAYWQWVEVAVFLALVAGFAVKVPLVPVHTWLPLAHVEAPTAGSVLLAGVLLKLGTYGILRLAIPLAPDAALSVGVPLLGLLASIGIIYGALCAFAQPDIKKLVAYSSVSHMGFCILGLFALNATGLMGGLLQMINHGLSTGGLFLLVGMMYERYHTRMMADYGGLAARLKLLGCFMMFMCLSSVGLPGLNGFIGEMLILAGVYDLKAIGSPGMAFAVCIAAGIVLGAWYLMTMLQKVFFGPVHEPDRGHGDHEPVADLNGRELWALVPLALVCLFIGAYPQPLIDAAKADVNVVARIADQARARAGVGVAETPAPKMIGD